MRRKKESIPLITISACLIVKNEEEVLKRCLDSIQTFADEIIIVDTGSTDRTKEIASAYTDKIYDFIWINDFSAARNASFQYATMDYIYVADADEAIDEENIKKILHLKQALLPEIDVVQMYYKNQLQFNTTYNYDMEYRPKLYKRLRTLRWMDPIHEWVQLDPIIYDSDIEILHLPISNHGKRDFSLFQKAIQREGKLSHKLNNMYARELYITGEAEDFLEAKAYFESLLEDELPEDELKNVQCILVKAARLENRTIELMKHSLKNVALDNPSSEVCYELGEYFYHLGDYKEAILWYYNAAFETKSDLNIHYSEDYPLKRLWECYEKLGDDDMSRLYKEQFHLSTKTL